MQFLNRSMNYKQSVTQTNQFSLVSNTPKSPKFIGLSRNTQDENQQQQAKNVKQIAQRYEGTEQRNKLQRQFWVYGTMGNFKQIKVFQNVNYEFPQNIFTIIFHLFQFVQKIILVWFVSVYRIYSLTQYHWPFVLGIVFLIVNLLWKSIITAKYYTAIKKQNNPHFNSSQHFKSLIQIYISELYTLIYYAILLIFNTSHKEYLGFVTFDFVAGVLQYQKGEYLYKKLKLYIIRSTYRHYMNLFDLMSNLFIIFHFCAILLFSLTLYAENNWIDSVKSDHEDWYSQYLYSIYFTSTTMLTVGYGDILPTNKLEVMIIIMIQVLGTATNGYIFSEVGHTLAKIREKKENQEKDISDTQKLAKVYRLDTELAGKIRQYIVHNEMQNQQLNVDEQNNLLHKLSDELRTEVNNCNHMQIIKENIFFLFYFSKKAQVQFAKRLQRKLFAPNETIFQIYGKEKLWIVTKGRLEIYTDRRQGIKFHCKKKVKQINKAQKRQISDNIFGYSSIICGKPTNLKAITKDFTVMYNLEKSQLKEVINENSNDLEVFCELKEKIIVERFPERLEVPRITSIREHYYPSIFFVIKKEKSMMRKINRKERKFIFRYERRSKRIRPIVIQKFNNTQENDSSEQSFHSEENVIPINETSTKVINHDERQHKYARIKQLQSRQFSARIITTRSYKRKYLNNKKYEQKRREQIIEKWNISRETQNLVFDSGKNFNAFFKRRNPAQVLQKIRRKDIIETQLTMVGETIGPFHPRQAHKTNNPSSNT